MKLSSPISVHYEITENCNHLCEHCYNYVRFKKTGISAHQKINPHTINQIIESIIDAEIFQVIMTGGEPLLSGDILFDAVKKLKDHNVQVSLNTNLTLLDENLANKIKNAGFNNILTSIVHYDPEIHDSVINSKGGLAKLVNSIELLASKNVRVGANMVVNKERVKDVYKTGEYLAKAGIKSFSATRMAPNFSEGKLMGGILDSKDVVAIFEQLIELKENYSLRVSSLNPTPLCFEGNEEKYDFLLRRGCAGGSLSATINSEGFIRACQHSYNNKYNIITNPVKTIWKNIDELRTKYLPESCKPCSEKYSCGGGCRETARAITGDFKSDDPLARGYKYVQKHKQEKKLNSKTLLRFHNDLKKRLEPNGAVLFRNPQAYSFISKRALEFIEPLLNKIFYVDQFKINGSEDLFVENFFNKLYSQKLICEVKTND